MGKLVEFYSGKISVCRNLSLGMFWSSLAEFFDNLGLPSPLIEA